MFREPLSDLMRDRRKTLAVQQSTLAALADIPPARWSQLERGTRSPRKAEISKIADALKLPPGKIAGSPRKPDKIHSKLRISRLRSTAKFQAYFPPSQKPAHAWYKIALDRWPGQVEELTARIAQREDLVKVEYLCGRLAFRSSEECLHALRLLDRGAAPALLSPMRLGYLPHPVVDPATRRRVEYRPFPCLVLDDSYHFFGISMETPELFTVNVLVWDGSWRACLSHQKVPSQRTTPQLPRRFLLPVMSLDFRGLAA